MDPAVLQEIMTHVNAVRAEMEQKHENRMQHLIADYEAKIQVLRGQVEHEVQSMKQMAANYAATHAHDVPTQSDTKDKGKSPVDRKGFGSLPRYSGGATEYEDWKFQMKTFLCKERGMDRILISIENQLEVPTVESMKEIFKKAYEQNFIELDFEVINRSLYEVLCLNLKDKALGICKNLFDKPEVNGFAAWWKLGYENNAMTSQRLQAMTNKVLAPKRCKKYSEVSAAVEDWEFALTNYERVEKTGGLSEQAKIFSIKRLVPEELEADMNRLNNLETFDKVKAYIVEQVLIRRDIKKDTAASGSVPMDVDSLQKLLANLSKEEHDWDEKDEDKAEEEESPECGECGEGNQNPLSQLLSMIKGKGGAKGGKGKGSPPFDGYCNNCGKYGHKKENCWSKQKGKGKGKNRDSWYNNPKGKGKGLNLWDFTTPTPGNKDQGANKKSPWALSLSKSTVRPPPGLTRSFIDSNNFEILRRQDLDDDELPELDKSNQANFPVIDEKRQRQRTRMPRMPNYSQNALRKMNEKLTHDQPKKPAKQLHVLIKAPPKHNLNNFEANKATSDEWIKIKGVMDSGASESVAPPSAAPHVPITPSEGSLVGQEYLSASNTNIPNLGEQTLEVVMDDGREKTIKYQIADVTRPLNSISEICDAGGEYGQVVVFGRSGGAICNLETGESTPFQREDGVYTMDVWLKPEGFTRQGK